MVLVLLVMKIVLSTISLKVVLMKSLFVSLYCVIFLTMAQGVSAQSTISPPQADGLSIGSYPYFFALNKRCFTPNTEKDAALASLRKQSIDLARSMIPMLAATVKPGGLSQAQFNETKLKLATMEKKWPERADLAEFDKIFDAGTATEIEALCEAMPNAIAQRQELIELLTQTNKDMAAMMKKSSNK
jgi:hypothetical protein